MARKERRAPRGERLHALLDAGDHASARVAARAILDDGAAEAPDRAEAARVLASLAPDRGAVLAGALGVAAAIAVAALAAVRG